MNKTASLLSILALSGCAAGAVPPPEPPPAPPAPAAPAAPAPLAPPAAAPTPAAPEVEGAPPLEVDYPLAGLATIPDDCKDPRVVLTTAPTKVGWGYGWTWTRQAFLASPAFSIVDGKPDRPMAVRLEVYEIPGGFALVGACHDGATCNKLGAMYQGAVPTCRPRLSCGALPFAGAPRPSALVPADGRWLPLDEGDVIGRCARIGVCMHVEHEPFRGNPGTTCQSAPSRFKTACATRATCGEVVACLR